MGAFSVLIPSRTWFELRNLANFSYLQIFRQIQKTIFPNNRRSTALVALVVEGMLRMCALIILKSNLKSSRTWLHRKIVHWVHTRSMIYYSFVNQWFSGHCVLQFSGQLSSLQLCFVIERGVTRQPDFWGALNFFLSSPRFWILELLQFLSGDVFEDFYPAWQVIMQT